MIERIRLILALSLLAGAASVVGAAPAHACFNPDDPICKVGRAYCDVTDPVAKYRDKISTCYP